LVCSGGKIESLPGRGDRGIESADDGRAGRGAVAEVDGERLRRIGRAKIDRAGNRCSVVLRGIGDGVVQVTFVGTAGDKLVGCRGAVSSDGGIGIDRAVVDAPASCCFKTPMICSSVNRLFFINRPPHCALLPPLFALGTPIAEVCFS
jgi:hypothetical protein